MAFPKQPIRIDPDRQALAPYNFVELPERIVALIEGSMLPSVPEEKKGMSPEERAAWLRAKEKTLNDRAEAVTAQLPDQNIYHANRHSGWIHCQLTSESPVYVRAPRTPEEARKRIQSKDLHAFFYEWDKGEPVIPGSTLRGMLRSLIEIASFGKVSDVHSRRLIYRAIGDTTTHGEKYREQLMRLETGKQSGNEKYYTPLMLGGYMRRHNSDWYIQPAQERDGTTFARIRLDDKFFGRLARVPNCNNARKVYIRVGPYDFQPVRGGFLRIRAARVLDSSEKPESGLFEATLAQSGYMFSKRSEAVIYPPDPNASKPDGWYKLEDDQIDDYRNQISPEQERLLGRGGVLLEGQPVFYTLSKDGKKVDFFGHCRMLRMPYPQSPRDFVPAVLRRDIDIDLAEAIFGYTKKLPTDKHCNKERRYAGRVRICSARLVQGQDNFWLSPNRPFTPLILGTPKPTTFQHYLVQPQPNAIKVGQTRDGRPKFEVRLEDYAAITPARTVTRGHKLYWHKGEVKQSDIELRERGKENVATQINPVRAGLQFEFRIQFENLSDVELGALLWVLQIGSQDSYRLKLGMGKSLGMGAMKANPTLHLLDREARYCKLFEEEEKVQENGEKDKEVKDTWESGIKKDEVSRQVEQNAIRAFEQFVIERIQPGAERLADLERIKQLLVMLQWPGPEPSITRYLEIERYDPSSRRGKRNEYDGRPVLPHPLTLKQREPVKPSPENQTPKPIEIPRQANKSEPDEKLTLTGRVVRWGLGPKRDNGFIKPDDGGKEVFVHASTLLSEISSLQKGDRVEYKLRGKEFGLEAVVMRILERGENEDGS